THYNSSYHNTELFSDVVVICDEHEIKAHRLVLSSHSKYFATQFNGPWKESSEQKVEITDFDIGIVEAMLEFMYKFDYSASNGTSAMIFDAQVYQIADKYDIAALKQHAMGKFGVAIETGWSLHDFPLAVAVAYDTTPPEDRGLRDLVIATSYANIDKLLINDSFCKVLRTTIDFAADLVPFLHGNAQNPSYRCPSCDRIVSVDLQPGSSYYCIHCGSRRSDWKSYRVSQQSMARKKKSRAQKVSNAVPSYGQLSIITLSPPSSIASDTQPASDNISSHKIDRPVDFEPGAMGPGWIATDEPDFSEAAQLSSWAALFIEQLEDFDTNFSNGQLLLLFESMIYIRSTAVERTRIEMEEIKQLLFDSQQLVSILKLPNYVNMIESLRLKVEEAIIALKRDTVAVQMAAEKQFSDLRAEREELE
ncbi:hypothetical protein S40288_08303, partial [Stachybotrys chartarum IBT 40288]